MWGHSGDILVVSRIHQILKAFFSSCIDPRAPAGRWLLCASVRAAKRLAWKLLRGFCSRLTVHHSGIRFTWCNSARDFLFHMIIYRLYAAPLSWFVKLLFQANATSCDFTSTGFFCNYAPWICRIDPFHMIPDVIPTQFEKPVPQFVYTLPAEVRKVLMFLRLPSSSDSPGAEPSTTWKLLPCFPHTRWIWMAVSHSAARSRSCWARCALSCLISNWRHSRERS